MKLTKKTVNRWCIYLAGMLLLSLGLTVFTKTGLGASPIIALPHCISLIWGLNLGGVTFAVYVLFAVLQLILKRGKGWVAILLQLPFSFVVSMLLNVFGALIPLTPVTLVEKLLTLLLAMLLTAPGAAMMVAMRLVPNPADGLAQAIGDALHRDMGLGKNLLDLLCLALTCAISLGFTGRLVGVGIGSVVSMVCVGRIISLFNRFALAPMRRAVE